ncbi:MAG: LexA family transcriptional regulator [Planctomycetia bacterium]|nr:LexA family transcriptional regulator [Planctomycetia bacterium]
MFEGPWDENLPTGKVPVNTQGHLPDGKIYGRISDMDMQEIRRRNLRKLIDSRFGGTQAGLARYLDVAPTTITRILGGKPVRDVIRNWEHALGYDYGALDSDNFDPTDPRFIGVKEQSAEYTIDSYGKTEECKNYIGIQAFNPKQISVGAGARYCLETEPESRPRLYSKEFFERHKLDAKNLRAYKVFGDSMEPMLQDGCWILVDITKTSVVNKKIYMLSVNDEIMVKQLVNGIAGKIIVNSYSPQYPSEVIDPSVEHVQIFGQVVEYSCVLI